MPTLSNPKHERFAQALAGGNTATKAYEIAGYKPSRHHGAELARKRHISERVAELLAERESIHTQATAKAIEQAGITKAWVISQLVEIAQRTMQHKPVTDAAGNPVLVETSEGKLAAAYKFDSKGATRAVELLGQELGMFIKRQELGKPGEFSQLDDESLNQRIYDELIRSGVPVGIAQAFVGAAAAD